jgi:adenine-specific DNA-methyltransferase
LLPRTEEANARYENPDNDPRGSWKPSDVSARNYYSKGQYEVSSPNGKKFSPPMGRFWAIPKEKFLELDKDKRIWWGPAGASMPALKRFLSEVRQGMVPETL